MLFWHFGIAAALVYLTLGRARIDYRFVLLGAVLPDAIDGLVVVAGGDLPAGRGPAHSLAAALAAAVLVVVLLRGERRLAWFGIFVGWLTHLVADGMWVAPKTFLWPAFGGDFEAVPAETYSWDVFARPWAHPTTWAAELVGVAILWWFVIAFGLTDAERRGRFWRDGRLRA